MLPDIGRAGATPEGQETILRVARLLEEEPSMMGSSAHLLAVVRNRRVLDLPGTA
jgi:hypothetical protein